MKMKALSNPWTKISGYNCYGCSPDNPFGLRMKFCEEEEFLICEWEPESQHQGYHNVLHGGIQATLMDEIASWTVFVKADKGGVTSKVEIKYRKPVYINKGIIKLRARILEVNKRIARVYVELADNENRLCSEAWFDYFIVASGKSEDGLIFPGKEAFYL
jgi:uncharacterized protein (TIGR00369 family)